MLGPYQKNIYNTVGRCGIITKWGHIMKYFGLSCVRTLCFLHKYTEFHDICTECQRILPTTYLS